MIEITKQHHEEDMDLMLEMGVNAMRLAHYQQDTLKQPAPAGYWHPENWQTYYHMENWKKKEIIYVTKEDIQMPGMWVRDRNI